jgi:hypothetical protein
LSVVVQQGAWSGDGGRHPTEVSRGDGRLRRAEALGRFALRAVPESVRNGFRIISKRRSKKFREFHETGSAGRGGG